MGHDAHLAALTGIGQGGADASLRIADSIVLANEHKQAPLTRGAPVIEECARRIVGVLLLVFDLRGDGEPGVRDPLLVCRHVDCAVGNPLDEDHLTLA